MQGLIFNVTFKDYLKDEKGYSREEILKMKKPYDRSLVNDFHMYLQEEIMRYDEMLESERD